MRELGHENRREIGRWENDRAKNLHIPSRQKEREMQRFRKMKALQKFVSLHANIHINSNSERHLIGSQTYKTRRSVALAE